MTEGKKVKKALLVIDMQNVCVGKNHATYFKYDNEILIQTVNEGEHCYLGNLRRNNFDVLWCSGNEKDYL